MAKRHWFPESSSEIRGGNEEARETTPECSKGGRLMNDPQNLGIEQVPVARLWEQIQPGTSLSLWAQGQLEMLRLGLFLGT